jgi:hypothetical protein
VSEAQIKLYSLSSIAFFREILNRIINPAATGTVKVRNVGSDFPITALQATSIAIQSEILGLIFAWETSDFFEFSPKKASGYDRSVLYHLVDSQKKVHVKTTIFHMGKFCLSKSTCKKRQ